MTRKLSSAQNRAELTTWLAAGARYRRRIETRAGSFLSKPARGFRGVEKRLPQNDGLARDTGSTVRNVSCCHKNFLSTINHLVADFCRSDSGCLRTILWKRDRNGVIASTKLPKAKFDPAVDQAAACSRRPAGDARASHPPSPRFGVAGSEAATVPLLCQEACNLLVAECRKVVKDESA